MPFVVPNRDEDTWTNITLKEFEANAIGHYAPLQALNDDDIFRMINSNSAYEIWGNLVVAP